MKKLNKGGLASLLSYFLLICAAKSQEAFVSVTDPTRDNYGSIYTPPLADSIILKIYEKEPSFTDWTTFFSIKTKGSSRSTLGSYSVDSSRVLFKPRFLPDPEVTYQVTLDYSSLFTLLAISDSATALVQEITFQQPKMMPSQVVSIYPLVNVLPSNTLKLYIYFSEPMGFSNPYDFISLSDAHGNEIKNAFVELPNGLWNEDRTRLTLLFHPGRVKQGVGPNLREGTALIEGELFELSISEDWTDENGQKLQDTFNKKFYVSAPSRKKLKIKSWELVGKCEKECELALVTQNLIHIEMADRMISVKNEKQEEISIDLLPEPDGSFIIHADDGFKKDEKIIVSIHPRLEDMCGNTFLNPFDYKEDTRKEGEKPLEIRFKVQ